MPSTKTHHPFDPLTPEEISLAVAHLKHAYPEDKIVSRVVTLLEAPKAQMIPFLEAEHSRKPIPAPKRTAFVQFYRGAASGFREVHVGLDTGKVSREKKLA